MSDDWITFVPRETGFVPSEQNVGAALKLLHSMAPDAQEIEVVRHESIQFFDCAANFESISCGNCGEEIDREWWETTMDKDYSAPNENGEQNGVEGFKLESYVLPCCSHTTSLDHLTYRLPQAFGRFGLSAMNANIGMMSKDQIESMETALGCDVVVVWTHI